MRAGFLTLGCLLLALVAYAPARTVQAAAPTPGNYYLALGDSLGVGVEAPGIPTDTTCQLATAPGYVCAFYRYLQQINPQIQLENVSESGANSCVLVHGFGNGSPCVDPLVSGTLPSQLDAAVQFLKAHPGQVSPITIDVGGDDFLPLLGEAVSNLSGALAQAPAVLQSYQVNVDTALAALRAAAPSAEIIVANQYNPIGGAPSAVLPTGFGPAVQQTLAALNGIMQQEAKKYNAVLADVAAAFDANPGGAYLLTFVLTSVVAGGLSNVNIHPTSDGYVVYTQTVIKASGYLFSPKISASLVEKQIARGKFDRVTGTTFARARVKVTIWRPGRKAQNVSVAAGSDGSFVRDFRVGKVAGKGAVRACTSDFNGQSVCTGRMAYTIH